MTTPQRRFFVSPGEYPFQSHWFEKNGAFMHYLDQGNGIPVLMLHGNPTWSFLYRKVVREFRDEARFIVPDYPGFGFSDHPPEYNYMPQEHARRVGELLDYIAPDQFIPVVHDWGGPIGMSLAVNRPEKVAALVICNTWCWPVERFLMRMFSAVLGSFIGRYLILQYNFFARYLMPAIITRPELKKSEILNAYTGPFPTPESRMGTYIFPWAINHSSQWLSSLESGLHILNEKPVEIIWGLKDIAFGNERTLGRWLKHFPNANIRRLPDTGHYVPEESPVEVANAIRRLFMQLHRT